MPTTRFGLDPMVVLTMLSDREHYLEAAYLLKIKSEPVAMPPMMNLIFPGQYLPSHRLVAMYTACVDFIRQIFIKSEWIEMAYSEPITEMDDAVRAELHSDYLVMESHHQYEMVQLQLANKLTLEAFIFQFESHLMRMSDLLALARAYVANKAPQLRTQLISSTYRMIPVPLDVAEPMWPECDRFNIDMDDFHVALAQAEDDEVARITDSMEPDAASSGSEPWSPVEEMTEQLERL